MSSSSTSTARGRYSGFPAGLFRFLSDLRRAMKPYGRRMTTEERRRFAREAAKDPRVEQALQELLAERPDFRMKDARHRGLPH